MKSKEFRAFITKSLIADLAKRIVEKLEKQGSLARAKHKDNLTDVIEILSPLLSDDDGQPAAPAGTVIAADGTVVTLGSQDKKNTSFSLPKRT